MTVAAAATGRNDDEVELSKFAIDCTEDDGNVKFASSSVSVSVSSGVIVGVIVDVVIVVSHASLT